MFLSRIFVGYFNSPVFNHCIKFSAVELKAIYLDVSFLHSSFIFIFALRLTPQSRLSGTLKHSPASA